MHPDRTVEVNLGVDEHDELDRKIDRALGRAGVLVRTLFVIGVLVALGLFVIYPQWETVGPFITTGLYLVFQLFYVAFMMIFQFIVLFWFIGRPRIYWLMPGETGVGFKDYKGNPEVLESARQVVTLLKGVKRFKLMGGQPIRGLLLEGPPGTGKSYLGQAIATEAQLPFGYMSAPSIQGMFWGMDTLRVLSLYNKARKLARKHGACILFIDEIDAIGKSRSGVRQRLAAMGGMMMGGGGGALNELLNQMDPLPKDGFKDKILRMFGLRKGKADQPPVLTIAATNLVSVLDQALLRPGRFDRQLRIGAPSYDGRREIFDFYLGKVKHVDLPIEQMVAETVNYTPAQVKHIVNEAVVHAVWNGRDAIDYADFRWALETYEWGMRMPVIGMTYADKRRLAYHEAGHAVATVKLLQAVPRCARNHRGPPRHRRGGAGRLEADRRDSHDDQGRAARQHADFAGEPGSRADLPGPRRRDGWRFGRPRQRHPHRRDDGQAVRHEWLAHVLRRHAGRRQSLRRRRHGRRPRGRPHARPELQEGQDAA